jgi:hypothetical protein
VLPFPNLPSPSRLRGKILFPLPFAGSNPRFQAGLTGWLTGFEPVLKEPQSSVLPLHHSHHFRIYFSIEKVVTSTDEIAAPFPERWKGYPYKLRSSQ